MRRAHVQSLSRSIRPLTTASFRTAVLVFVIGTLTACGGAPAATAVGTAVGTATVAPAAAALTAAPGKPTAAAATAVTQATQPASVPTKIPPTAVPTALPTKAAPTPTRIPERIDGLKVVTPDQLPKEARDTLALIAKGGPFPFDRDGITFGNFEGLLPQKPRNYYKEYTVITPGSRDRGARRIIAGANGELYYTADHYESFVRVITAGK